MDRTKKKAVIIGSGFSGLFAARILSRHYEQVVVLEKNPEAPPELGTGEYKKAATQHRYQLHTLLKRGEQSLLVYFPEIEKAWQQSGAVQYEEGEDQLWKSRFGVFPRVKTGVTRWSMSRCLLLDTLKAEIEKINNVELRQGCKVKKLIVRENAVVGVNYISPERESLNFEADLVVSAEGKGSLLAKWLEHLDCGKVRTAQHQSRFAYSARVYRLNLDSQDWKTLMVSRGTRHGQIFPIENGLSVVTLVGNKPDSLPQTEKQFLKFARSLEDGTFSALLQEGEPMGGVTSCKKQESYCRHYDEMEKWPDGLIVVGDSLCLLDPLYGQGMTVSAINIELLDRILSDNTALSKGWERKFHASAIRNVAEAWSQATGEKLDDAGQQQAALGRQRSLRETYVSWVTEQAYRSVPHSRKAFVQFIQARNLMSPADDFFTLKNILRGLLPRMAAALGRKLSGSGLRARNPVDRSPVTEAGHMQ